jgi:hypothetical protein
MHIKRVSVEIRPLSSLVTEQAGPKNALLGRLVLNDLTPKGVGLFAAQALQPGQEVAVVISEPSMIFLKGKVTWCQEADTSGHVISDAPLRFRMGIRFSFADANEESAVQRYCEMLVKTLMPDRAEAA